MTRLVPGLILALSLSLGGCLGGKSSDNNNNSNPTPSPSSSPTPSPTPGSSPTPSPTVSPTPSPSSSPSPTPATGKTFLIRPGPDATSEMLSAIVQARPGDVIEFACGFFDLSAGIQIIGTENITIRGCGREKTVLSFRSSSNLEGILATNVRGLLVEDLTVLDTQANGIELRGVRFGTLRNVRTMWSSGRKTENEDTITATNYQDKLQVSCTVPSRSADDISPDYQVSLLSGRYGIYPVSSENILVDNAESIGASDAGIYIGQTIKGIIKNSRTAFNVFGFEIENVQGSEYVNNLAECNTGGFLVYDLDGLKHHGKRAQVHNNIARKNNTYNFAEPGSIVANVPPGSGFITLAYDKIDIFDNEFYDHDTAAIILTSYEMLGLPSDKRMDVYSEGVHIWNNKFVNSGNNLPPPNFQAIIETGGEQYTSVFPAVVGMKVAAGKLAAGEPSFELNDATFGGNYRGAHIIWDGYIDEEITQHPDGGDCPYPTDDDGNPIPADEDGKPESGNRYPNPDCTYNAYKFDEQIGEPSLNHRIVPKWWFACIDAGSNDFSGDSLSYANFHGTEGLDSALALSGGNIEGAVVNLATTGGFPADFEIGDHDCVARFGETLPPLPSTVLDEYQPSGSGAGGFTPEEVAARCNSGANGNDINRDAVPVNCPTLQDYALFNDPSDPRSAPRGHSVPFVLNSKLFSDYATKYRVAYLPPGESAMYRDYEGAGVNATLLFPVGTVIAKTFAFTDEVAGTEELIETRLLIKRQHDDGTVYWDGIPYIWEEDGTARLALEGGSASVSWDFTDPDTSMQHSGSTDSYSIPHQNQCASCHFNLDNETGSAPIGPKVRNLNRPYMPESSWPSDQAQHAVLGQNQIAFWCSNGLLSGCPQDMSVDTNSQIASNLPRVPKYTVAGDSGFTAGSDADIEARARAYLEVNCQHCHNADGFASNTGFFLDIARAVDTTYGICKKPTASGSEGRGGRIYDIHPGRVDNSVLPFRIGPDAVEPAAKMPPLARSVVDEEGYQLIRDWIANVITVDPEKYPGSDQCSN